MQYQYLVTIAVEYCAAHQSMVRPYQLSDRALEAGTASTHMSARSIIGVTIPVCTYLHSANGGVVNAHTPTAAPQPEKGNSLMSSANCYQWATQPSRNQTTQSHLLPVSESPPMLVYTLLTEQNLWAPFAPCRSCSQVAREAVFLHRRSEAVRQHADHHWVDVRVRQAALLQHHAQHLLQRLAPAERQLQWLLAV